MLSEWVGLILAPVSHAPWSLPQDQPLRHSSPTPTLSNLSAPNPYSPDDPKTQM